MTKRQIITTAVACFLVAGVFAAMAWNVSADEGASTLWTAFAVGSVAAGVRALFYLRRF